MINIDPTILRLSAGIPTAGIGGLIGYLTGPANHKAESVARGAGIGYMTGTGLGIGSQLGSMATEQENQLPAMLAGGLAGGAAGFGVGKTMQGTPPWETRQKFREELLELLRTEASKIKEEVKQPILEKPAEEKVRNALQSLFSTTEKIALSPALTDLLIAKKLSDQKDYKGKHARLRSLIEKYPDDFYIDSQMGDIVGLTHKTGFRIHAPMKVLPPVKLRRYDDSITKFQAA